MLKVMALLRTVFLVFIIAFTVRSMPFSMEVPRTLDEQYSRASAAVGQLQRAAWYAIGWIAFETAVGWWLASRRPRPSRAVAPPPASTSTSTGTGTGTGVPR